MTNHTEVTPLAVEDYDAIESAVMETTRGRWFLAEYARRNRNADTDQILTSLERIERTIRRDRAAPDIDRIRLDLADMAEAISRTKQEIAQMKHDTGHGGRFADAGHELDAIVGQTETATNEILLAAEHIQEAAWTLREAGAPDELCDKLDANATEIYTACSFQDLTGQRTRKVVTALRYLESRINAMMAIWGLDDVEDLPTGPVETAPADTHDNRPDAHLLNGPQLDGRGIQQSTVDDLMWSDVAVAEAEQPPGEEPPVFAPTDEPPPEIEASEIEADIFAAADDADEPAASLTADFDLSEADVFSSEATDRLAAAVREHREVEPEAEFDEPETMTVVVGNTLRSVAVEAAAETAPALAVVEVEDPIGDLSARARLVTFG